MAYFTKAQRDERREYLDKTELSPGAFAVIVAVMAAERVTLAQPKRTEIATVLGERTVALNIAELIRGRWLYVEGKSIQHFTATAKAWRWSGESREGYVAPVASLGAA